MIFKDREEGGIKLAEKLKHYKNKNNVIILGLPRGGVVTAFEIARELNLPMDIIVPRKIGAPKNHELAIGAITEDGEGILDAEIISSFNISPEYIENKIRDEKEEAKRRIALYRAGRGPLILENKISILVDDGIATGYTMLAAIKTVKDKKVKKIIVAVPVTSQSALKVIKKQVDEVVFLDAPFFFDAVGAFYEIFAQTEDNEVIELMKKTTKFK